MAVRMDLIIKKEWFLPKIDNDDLNLTFQLQVFVIIIQQLDFY